MDIQNPGLPILSDYFSKEELESFSIFPNRERDSDVCIIIFNGEKEKFKDIDLTRYKKVYFCISWDFYLHEGFDFWTDFKKELFPLPNTLDIGEDKDPHRCDFCFISLFKDCQNCLTNRDCECQRIHYLTKYPLKELYNELIGKTYIFHDYKLTRMRQKKEISFEEYLNILKGEKKLV